MKVSLIATVLNGADHIEDFLGSLAAQTRAPDEVVIVDGGSTDGTVDLLARAEGVTLIEEPGANISRGRNVAIAGAAHDVIAVTDADCVLEPTWLEELLRPLDEGADVAMGFYLPITDGFLSECLAAVNLPFDASEVDPATFMPSAAVGGLPSRRDRVGGRLPGVARHRRGHVGEPSVARARTGSALRARGGRAMAPAAHADGHVAPVLPLRTGRRTGRPLPRAARAALRGVRGARRGARLASDLAEGDRGGGGGGVRARTRAPRPAARARRARAEVRRRGRARADGVDRLGQDGRLRSRARRASRGR